MIKRIFILPLILTFTIFVTSCRAQEAGSWWQDAVHDALEYGRYYRFDLFLSQRTMPSAKQVEDFLMRAVDKKSTEVVSYIDTNSVLRLAIGDNLEDYAALLYRAYARACLQSKMDVASYIYRLFPSGVDRMYRRMNMNY